MKLVVNTSKSSTKTNKVSAIADQKAAGFSDGNDEASLCVETSISMLGSIVESACEFEHDISLMRLVNLMDLYSSYLRIAREPDFEHKSENSGPVNFEAFIRDSHLLDVAAHAATMNSADHVATPAPLGLSANC